MITILDSTALTYMALNNVALTSDAFVTFDVKEEMDVIRATFPAHVRDAWNSGIADNEVFLDCYKSMLNKHGGSSFYNHTGFGDVSILALLKAIQHKESGRLIRETVQIVTSDAGLTKRLSKEVAGFSEPESIDVVILDPADMWKIAGNAGTGARLAQ
jgi:hypothetical protein